MLTFDPLIEQSGTRAPSPVLTGLEQPRALVSMISGAWSRRSPTTTHPGGGTPVLTIPGFGTSDLHLSVLRRYLQRLGYQPYRWNQGVNVGPTRHAMTGLRDRLNQIASDHQGPVALVGWSLGGVFARELAREQTDHVRHVITLASPIRLEHHDQSRARIAYRAVSAWHERALDLPLEADAPALPVPSTALYSRTDGIVAWRTCMDVPSPTAENIEVNCAHFSFPVDSQVLAIAADRLRIH
ncbi:alpha/beta hydrolase [Gordonia sp. TBRC 11910]|uniref:Alpha/beta hydrolase n=1 Tax=Gordonia asplenii TaxID=2725283 RepID=A0A848KMZ4_9ACTN|nr:alpha/beta hydrolase [Gordonia asplenii]NMO00046.1 alpha/beta hydrolase [Gordonia asplenii]